MNSLLIGGHTGDSHLNGGKEAGNINDAGKEITFVRTWYDVSAFDKNGEVTYGWTLREHGGEREQDDK